MNTKFRVLLISLLVFSLAACTFSVDVEATQPPASDQVATVVAQTMEAIPPTMESIPPTMPSSSADVLAHSFYFLGKDSQSLNQIFRIEHDGKTTTQLTFEPVDVLDYDVSTRDGSLVYEVDNRLTLINADGSNPRNLEEGPAHGIIRGIYHPVFSPNGEILAYAQNGLVLHSLPMNTFETVLNDQPLGGNETPIGYYPDVFSPDGTKLLVTVIHPPDSPSTSAIYSLADKTLTQFLDRDETPTCCTYHGGASWTRDSAGFLGVATTPDSSYVNGELWKVDAASGSVTQLTTSSAGQGDTLMIHFPYKPYLAPDGHLYFFFAKYPESAGYFRRAPLILIRSLPDDITMNWTILRPESFELMNEALWSPDAGFLIVAIAPSEDVFDGGRAEIVYLDGRPNMLLTGFAKQMKWGP